MRQQENNDTLSFSEQLTQHIASKSFDIADMFSRASQSYPQNIRKLRICITLAVVAGFTIGALAMHFLSSPERWIRL